LPTPNPLPIALGAAVLLVAAGLYAHETASPACTSQQAMDRVISILRTDFHLDSLLVNAVKTDSGTWFSRARGCSAEVTQIRGNVDAATMPWRAINYRIDQPDPSAAPNVTVQLGTRVPLAAKTPSLWKRFLASL
jgi:hypothetical protein